MRREAVSVGPATRGVEPGATEGDRADAAQRAGATGVSGSATQVAGTACRQREETAGSEAGAGGEKETGGTGPGVEPSVAAGWRGIGAAVLAWDQGAWARGAAGGAGLRSASATLRPPCVPHRQPGKPNDEQQPTKGTFSRELYRGHF